MENAIGQLILSSRNTIQREYYLFQRIRRNCPQLVALAIRHDGSLNHGHSPFKCDASGRRGESGDPWMWMIALELLVLPRHGLLSGEILILLVGQMRKLEHRNTHIDCGAVQRHYSPISAGQCRSTRANMRQMNSSAFRDPQPRLYNSADQKFPLLPRAVNDWNVRGRLPSSVTQYRVRTI